MKPRNAPAEPLRPCDGAPGSEFPLRQLLEHVDIQRLLGDQLLQPLVLCLERLQALGLIGLHPAIDRPPPVERRLRDFEMAQHLNEILTLIQKALALPDLPNSLLRGMPASLHDRVHPSIPSRETRPRTQPGSLHWDPVTKVDLKKANVREKDQLSVFQCARSSETYYSDLEVGENQLTEVPLAYDHRYPLDDFTAELEENLDVKVILAEHHGNAAVVLAQK